MRTVLAALDASAAATPVLATALGIAELTGATVDAVHVEERPVETPARLAARAGVTFRLLEGPVEPALLDAMASPEVVAAVLGTRGTPAGRRPAGRTALQVLEQANKPVVVVPPDALSVPPLQFRRLLVPLEGTQRSSRPVEESLCPLIVDDVELVVLHVFTPTTMPRFLDHPGRDLELLGGEFLARYFPNASRIELRTGAVGSEVAALARDEEADLIVLSWSQNASPGHAAVINHVLSHAAVPVLLVPVTAEPLIDLKPSPRALDPRRVPR